jgi:predicted lactoylglutathione lyase
MIGYTTLGTNDLDRAVAFYDALLAEFGAGQMMNDGRIVIWAAKDSQGGMLAVCKPHDEQTASVGNGVMVALNAGSQDKVNSLYAKALELGATDEGEPGPRGEGGFYGAYFRDLDGNKLAAFTMG